MTYSNTDRLDDSHRASVGYYGRMATTEVDDINGSDEDRGNANNCDVPSAGLHTFINDPANQIYAVNLIHFFSQISDSLVTACGGLLPLLAAATSATVSHFRSL